MSKEIEQVIEGNKLIDVFAHPEYTIVGDWIHWNDGNGSRNHVSTLKYHSSWDWLMPVVEKIEGMGYQTLLKKHMNRRKTDHEMLYYDRENGDCIIEADFTYKSKIDCVYQATISFIQWYNTQQPTTTVNK